MRAQQHPKLRQGNRALDYLLAHQLPTNEKLRTLADSLTTIADTLYRGAQQHARDLLRNHPPNFFVRLAPRLAWLIWPFSPSKEVALANSVFDLQLTAAFDELFKFLDDKEAASVFVDALVFQATGFEVRSATPQEILQSTHQVRGIAKFQEGHKEMPHVRDITGWMFGKEFAAIVYGTTGIAEVTMGTRYSLLPRVYARWRVRFLLYGTLPPKQEQDALAELLKNDENAFQKLTDSLTKQND